MLERLSITFFNGWMDGDRIFFVFDRLKELQYSGDAIIIINHALYPLMILSGTILVTRCQSAILSPAEPNSPRQGLRSDLTLGWATERAVVSSDRSGDLTSGGDWRESYEWGSQILAQGHPREGVLLRT